MATQAHAEHVTHRRRPSEYVIPVIGLSLVAIVLVWLGYNLVPRTRAVVPRLPDRGDERRALRSRRARLHACVRHSRADQLRPRRRVHARRDDGRLADHRLRSDRGVVVRIRPARHPHLARCGHDRVRAHQRVGRTDRLQAAAKRAASRAVDHCDRHVVHPPERRHRLEGDGDDLGRQDAAGRGRSSRSAACRTRGTGCSSCS